MTKCNVQLKLHSYRYMVWIAYIASSATLKKLLFSEFYCINSSEIYANNERITKTKELFFGQTFEIIDLPCFFQRIFVLPNMDDLVVPLLLSGNPECAHHPDATPFSKP